MIIALIGMIMQKGKQAVQENGANMRENPALVLVLKDSAN